MGAAQVAAGSNAAPPGPSPASQRGETGALPRRVLGIDPGLACTGYGVLELIPGTIRLCEAGVVRSRATASLPARLDEIYQGVCEVISAFRPAVLALEQLYSHHQHPRTSVLMAHARGVICLAGAQASIEVAHYAATQVKKTLTGSGRAGKSQIQRAVCRELSLAAPPQPPDVADALALALCHVYLDAACLALLHGTRRR